MDENIWANIYKRLPAKTLCRFQCVSRHWKSTISSSFIVNLHHSFASSSTPYHLKPYLRVLNCIPEINRSIILCRPLCDKLNHSIQELHCPYPASRYDDYTVVGVIRGVVCVSAFWSSSDPRYPDFFSAMIWNPSTHKYVPLPLFYDKKDSPFSRIKFGCFIDRLGFGYDKINKDFKLVLIFDCLPRLQLSYLVYSSRRHSWSPPVTTPPVDFTDNPLILTSSCFVNGNIHWLLRGRFSNEHYLLTFDCESEVWRDWKKMELEIVHHSNEVKIVEYVGMVGVLVNHE